jgi:hypothetical protein
MAVTNKLLQRVINYLNDDITHIALGTGIVPNAESTLLDGETNRKLSDNNIDGNTLIVEGFWDTSEGNGTYTNAGCFGNGATDTIETGELFTGGAVDITKNSTQSLTLTIEITIEEGV